MDFLKKKNQLRPNRAGVRRVRPALLTALLLVALLVALLYLADVPGASSDVDRRARAHCAARALEKCDADAICRRAGEQCRARVEAPRGALLAAFATVMVAFVVGRVVSGG